MTLFLFVLCIVSIIFIIKGYMEEIFERAEKMFGDVESAYSWLMGFDKPKKNAYEKAGFQLGKDVGNYIEIQDKLPTSNTIEKLKDLQDLAKGITFDDLRSEILPDIQGKIKELEEAEEIEETEAREKEEAERIKRTLIEEASTKAFLDGKISRIVTTEEERQELSLRDKQILGRYMTQLR